MVAVFLIPKPDPAPTSELEPAPTTQPPNDAETPPPPTFDASEARQTLILGSISGALARPPLPTAPPGTILVPAQTVRIGLEEPELEALRNHPELTRLDSEHALDLDFALSVYRARDVALPALFVHATEITWSQWTSWVEPGESLGCSLPLPVPGPDNVAVTGVSATEAQAFCQSIGMRLPTAEEWEAIAHGKPFANTRDVKAMQALASLRPLPGATYWNQVRGGIFDMSGGVREWVRCTGELEYCRAPFGTRGGAWSDTRLLWMLTSVMGFPPAKELACLRHDAIGFRCVQNASSR